MNTITGIPYSNHQEYVLIEQKPDAKEALELAGNDLAPWTTRQTFLGLLLTLIPWMLLALLLSSLNKTTSTPGRLPVSVDLIGAITTLIFSLIIEGAFIIAPLYYAQLVFRPIKPRARLAFQALGFRAFPAWRTFSTIVGLMALIFAINFLYSVLITTFHLNLQTNDQIILEYSKQAPLTTYATLFSAVFIAPFCEEIFFRGFVFQGLRRGMPVVAAIFLSSLIFAAAHADIGSFAVLFIIGLALAFLRWRTRSIWPSMILHMLNNGIGALTIILTMQGILR